MSPPATRCPRARHMTLSPRLTPPRLGSPSPLSKRPRDCTRYRVLAALIASDRQPQPVQSHGNPPPSASCDWFIEHTACATGDPVINGFGTALQQHQHRHRHRQSTDRLLWREKVIQVVTKMHLVILFGSSASLPSTNRKSNDADHLIDSLSQIILHSWLSVMVQIKMLYVQ